MARRIVMAVNAASPALQLKVPSFKYSDYYPTMLQRPETTDAQREKYNPVNAQQYLAECHNMAAHGLKNPNIYVGQEQDEVGNIHFTHLSRILDLREVP